MLTDRLFARSARPSGNRAETAPSRWHHGPWWSNSYLLTPLLSILVFLVVMSLILWSLNRREQQQQEDTLYRNVAWAQQQIRLSMTGAQEQLQALARDIAAGHTDQHAFEMSTADIIQAHPEILYLNWYTTQKQPRWPDTPLPLAGQRFARLTDAQMDEAVKAAFVDARSSRRQVYSPLIYDDVGNGYLTLQTPIYRDREFLGSIAAVFSIEGILKHDIPPELSAKYKISITDANNRELATTSTRPRLPRDIFYDLPLDPPGQGVTVRVYAFPQVTNFTNNTLVWLVAGLSCFVLWSLWSLWKHTRQRFEAQ